MADSNRAVRPVEGAGGAYVNRQTVGSWALVVILAGVAAYMWFGRERPTALPKRFTIHGVCLACRKPVEIEVELGQGEPYTCPHCGKQAVFEWLYCRNCRHRFIPQPVPDPAGSGLMRSPVIPVCPGCGSSDVAQWFPEDPDQKPVGDLPLPSLPR